LRYLKGSLGKGLFFKKTGVRDVIGFSDAN